MKTNNKKITYPCFRKHLEIKMKDKKFREAFKREGQRLEVAYQIAKLRKQKKLSQKALARKLDTTQSAIARMETGQQNLTTDTLQKIAAAFNCNLKIQFIR